MEMTLPQTAAVEISAPVSTPQKPMVSEEQIVYANLLDIGMKAGLALLVVTFALYVSGIATPVVPLNDLPMYWTMPVGKYLAATGLGTGWSWVGLIARGDFMNFIGIAFLSGVTIVCYLRILPIPLKNRENMFGAILVVEALVLILGASGILSAGH